MNEILNSQGTQSDPPELRSLYPGSFYFVHNPVMTPRLLKTGTQSLNPTQYADPEVPIL